MGARARYNTPNVKSRRNADNDLHLKEKPYVKQTQVSDHRLVHLSCIPTLWHWAEPFGRRIALVWPAHVSQQFGRGDFHRIAHAADDRDNGGTQR